VVWPSGGLGWVRGLLVVPLQDIRKPNIVSCILKRSEPFVAEDVLFLAVLVVKVCPFGNRASFSGVTFFRAFQLLHLLHN
jgi:hypothetical protein